jgi:hypothetical protein
LAGAGILALLIASFVAEETVMRGLGLQDGPGRAEFIMGGRLIMLFGLASVPLAQVVLTRLRDVVETVERGDPFVLDNAARLRGIAWAVLGMEGLHLAIGSVARQVSESGQPFDISWDFSLARWLTVLLLFVLAQVFEQGSRMREDLAGTI